MRQELRKVNKELTVNDKDEIETTIGEVLKLSYMAKREGLMYLDEYAEKINEENELKTGLSLIVDGYDFDTIENILWNNYYANGYEGLEALKAIIYIIACLRIQDGTPVPMLEIELRSLVKREISSMFSKSIHQKATEASVQTKSCGIITKEEVRELLQTFK